MANNRIAAKNMIIYHPGVANIAYSDINTNAPYCDFGIGSTFGSGIINTNPLFAGEVAPYDVHLKSTIGRYSNGVWVVDAVHSPCIDAGDSSPYSNEPEPNGNKINLGRYGNTAEASKSLAIRITNDGGVSKSCPHFSHVERILGLHGGSAGIYLDILRAGRRRNEQVGLDQLR